MGSFFDREVQRLESTTDRLTVRTNEKKNIESSKLEVKKVGQSSDIERDIIYCHGRQDVLSMVKLIGPS